MGGDGSLTNNNIDYYGNYCVCCGAVIPEGIHVCPNCERKMCDVDDGETDNQEGQCG